MENPIKMGWFGGTTIFGNIHIMCWLAWTKPALLSSCLCRTSLKQSSLYLPLALDLSRPTKKMQPNISISSTQHQKIQVSSICQWIGIPSSKTIIQKKNNNPPTFLFTKISSMETANFSSSGRLRSSSLQRLYTRCCGCRLRKNLCTSAMGFRNWACHEPLPRQRHPENPGKCPRFPWVFFGNPCNWYINPYQYYKLDDHLLL